MVKLWKISVQPFTYKQHQLTLKTYLLKLITNVLQQPLGLNCNAHLLTILRVRDVTYNKNAQFPYNYLIYQPRQDNNFPIFFTFITPGPMETKRALPNPHNIGAGYKSNFTPRYSDYGADSLFYTPKKPYTNSWHVNTFLWVSANCWGNATTLKEIKMAQRWRFPPVVPLWV